MRTKHWTRFRIVSILLLALPLLAVELVRAAVATDEDTPHGSSCTDENGACPGPGPSSDDEATASWTDSLFGGDDDDNTIAKFLETKIFRRPQEDQDTMAGQGRDTDHAHPIVRGFLSLLTKEEDQNKPSPTAEVRVHVGEDKKTSAAENPFYQLLDRLSELGLGPKKGSQKEDQVPSDSLGEEQHDLMTSLLAKAVHLNRDDEPALAGLDVLGLMQQVLQSVIEQLQNTFGDVMQNADASLPFALIYFLANQDSVKTPSWKRRQHRFYPRVSQEIVIELHDALYLSQLAYVDSVEQFSKGLARFQDNQWELAYGTTESLPHLPAHFLLIHKKLTSIDKPLRPTGAAVGMEAMISPWELYHGDAGEDPNELTVALVVRGTKHLSDVLADALLEPVEYRGGFAHGGILASGKALVEKHLPKLKALLDHAPQLKSIRLYLVGHSLGAAAASIAAMEFNDYDFIKVEAVGFGCPSLLSKELSESTKEFITTVVSDADIVPRASGASVTNLLLDLFDFDWTQDALEDLEDSLDRAKETLPLANYLPPTTNILQWTKDLLDKEVRPKLKTRITQERIPSSLIPPGKCIHFFRDGVGYTGAFTPCTLFSSIDLARTLIDDHLVMPGYHRAMVNIVRDWRGDHNFDFEHDIASIEV